MADPGRTRLVLVARVQQSALREAARTADKRREVTAVATLHARRYAVIPLLQDEPVGFDKLRALSRSGRIAA